MYVNICDTYKCKSLYITEFVISTCIISLHIVYFNACKYTCAHICSLLVCRYVCMYVHVCDAHAITRYISGYSINVTCTNYALYVIYMCMYLYLYISVHVCLYAYMYIYIHIYIYIYIYI